MKDVLFFIGGILLILLLALLCVAAAIYIRKAVSDQTRANRAAQSTVDIWYDLAFRDALTGLLNRNAYHQRIHRACGNNCRRIWIILFDIDNLKQINDTNGHLYGDEVLRLAADRLRSVFEEDSIYRIGGDEFLIIAEHMDEKAVSDQCARLETIEQQAQDFRFSKGFSLVEQDRPNAFEAAFDRADQMLYREKRSRKQNSIP